MEVLGWKNSEYLDWPHHRAKLIIIHKLKLKEISKILNKLNCYLILTISHRYWNRDSLYVSGIGLLTNKLSASCLWFFNVCRYDNCQQECKENQRIMDVITAGIFLAAMLGRN